MTAADLAELRAWAEALAPAGCKQAQQVLAILAAHAELAAVWDAAVKTYPQPTVMPEPLRRWWERLYAKITGT